MTSMSTSRSGRNPSLTIRAERPVDAGTIADVVARAYADVPHSDHREHLMIARLRDTRSFRPALSLLAEAENRAVGHILLTGVGIRGARSSVASLALAPLSVVPCWQRRGVGRRLILAAHERAVHLGFGSIVLIGMPAYYARFGYEPLSRYPITIPFDVPQANCMIAPLRAGALANVEGTVEYPSAWMRH